MSGTREENVFMARLAEQAERYGDMIEYMKRVASMGPCLSLDERNLLSVAYKNSVGLLRAAWRAMYTSEHKEEAANKHATVELIMNYRLKVEAELNEKCKEIINIVTAELIPNAEDTEAKVFYMKMKGDYYRYMAEFTSGPNHNNLANEAHNSYQTAHEIATAGLEPTHPIRLGLALNYSVFYHEVMSSPDKACALAREAFDNAKKGLEGAPEETYKESAAIVQLLHDNLVLWTSDPQGGEGKPPEQDGTAVEEL